MLLAKLALAVHSGHQNAVLSLAAAVVWAGNRSVLQQSSWAAADLVFHAENLEESKGNPYLDFQDRRHMGP